MPPNAQVLHILLHQCLDTHDLPRPCSGDKIFLPNAMIIFEVKSSPISFVKEHCVPNRYGNPNSVHRVLLMIAELFGETAFLSICAGRASPN